MAMLPCRASDVGGYEGSPGAPGQRVKETSRMRCQTHNEGGIPHCTAERPPEVWRRSRIFFSLYFFLYDQFSAQPSVWRRVAPSALVLSLSSHRHSYMSSV